MRLLSLLPLLLFLIGETLSAQTHIADKTYGRSSKTSPNIVIESLFGTVPSSGYLPVRVKMTNPSNSDRTWNLNFTSQPSDYYYNNSGRMSISSQYTCSCKAGEEAVVDFIVPIRSMENHTHGGHQNADLQVIISTNGHPNHQGSTGNQTHPQLPSILLSSQISRYNRSKFDSEVNSQLFGGTHVSRYGSLRFGGSFNPKDMPSDWRVYVGYDVILLTADEWRDLNPSVRTTLVSWVKLGGYLQIYTPAPSPLPTLASLNIIADGDSPGFGKIRLLPCSKKMKIDPSSIVSELTGAHEELNSSASYNHDYTHSWELGDKLGKKAFRLGLIILILIIFGIIVGPVNLFVFAKSGNRAKLFFTTPLISLVTTVLLIVIIVLQDGFGGKGHRIAIMEIGQGDDHNAYIHQEQICRTGMLFSSGFETSETVFNTPVRLRASRWTRHSESSNSTQSLSISQNGTSQTFSGDWFQSRSEQGHALSTLRPNRGKLELSAGSGTPSLTSSFSFDVGEIFYRDLKGKIWTASGIPTSQTVALTESSEAAMQEWLENTSDPLSKRKQRLVHRAAKRPGSFITVSENAPLIDTADYITWESSSAVITGKL